MLFNARNVNKDDENRLIHMVNYAVAITKCEGVHDRCKQCKQLSNLVDLMKRTLLSNFVT